MSKYYSRLIIYFTLLNRHHKPEVGTVTVPILDIRKLKFREEILSDFPKVTQLTSMELRFEPDQLNPKTHTHNHSF